MVAHQNVITQDKDSGGQLLGCDVGEVWEWSNYNTACSVLNKTPTFTHFGDVLYPFIH